MNWAEYSARVAEIKKRHAERMRDLMASRFEEDKALAERFSAEIREVNRQADYEDRL